MEESRSQLYSKVFEEAFIVALVGKLLNGIIELLLGVWILFSASTRIYELASRITAHELQEDPADIIANAVIRFGEFIGSSQQFVSLYLLIHGGIKIILVYFLFSKRVRLYPWAISALVIFTAYQAYITVHVYSTVKLFLTLLDLFITVLAIYEYLKLRNHEQA